MTTMSPEVTNIIINILRDYNPGNIKFLRNRV